MDLLLIAYALPVVLPLGLLCALLIKLNSWHNPVLFKQIRTGQHGRRFLMYKFRTMVVNAER